MQLEKQDVKHLMWQPPSTLTMSEDDSFLGHLVGFSCCSNVGHMLITSFGDTWVPGAICNVLDSSNGHIVGVVMRRSKSQNCLSAKASVAYDIAWEHTILGKRQHFKC
jgi:hypothetical protein